MSKQLAKHILMVQPSNFGYNSETAKNNAFQKKGKHLSSSEIQKTALKEFKKAVNKIRKAKIDVLVVKDSKAPKKPDAVFPNNWLSTHRDGTVVTYPMYSKKRRHERNPTFIQKLEKHFTVRKQIQLEAFEDAEMFLEGTGSMILDRDNKIAYACQSERTDPIVFNNFCQSMGYKPCLFTALDKSKQPIYHTNVMMSVGTDFVMICSKTIRKKKERKRVLKQLKKTGKKVIEISYKQMISFACNTLQVRNKKGKRYLLMSSTAYSSLDKKQLKQLKSITNVLHCTIPTIEYFGGGSLRCMVAEIFLKKT